MPRTLEAQVSIDAPLERVWREMTGLARYGEWNPFVVGIDLLEGPPGVGARLRLHVDMQGSRTTALEEMTVWTTPSDTGGERAEMTYEFRGPMHSTGMVHATRRQVLTREADGRTTYHTTETFSGLLWRFIPFPKIRVGFDMHAQALKARCEGPEG